MITVPLDEAYLVWLYSRVGKVNLRSPSKTHWNLLRFLFSKEFIWLIPNDDNRAADGRDLRHEFLFESRISEDEIDPFWMELGCSFLEMLIGLARRLAFEEDDGDPRACFWHLISVLELDGYTDNVVFPYEVVDDKINAVIWRTYRKDGHGGLFPLKHPREDQREIELWYQLNAYLMEQGL